MTKNEALAAIHSLMEYLELASEDDDYVIPDDALSLLADIRAYIGEE